MPSWKRRIDAARRAWREGFVAEAIDTFCANTEAMDASGRRHRGVLSGDDMAKWQAHVETPLTYDYRGWTVAKCGPWSQGPAFLQQLAILKHFDLDAMEPAGPDFVHTVVEAAKLAFADREAWYGDPDFVDVPMADLLSDAYNAQRAELIGPYASLDMRPGNPMGKAKHWRPQREELPNRPGRLNSLILNHQFCGCDTSSYTCSYTQATLRAVSIVEVMKGVVI